VKKVNANMQPLIQYNSIIAILFILGLIFTALHYWNRQGGDLHSGDPNNVNDSNTHTFNQEPGTIGTIHLDSFNITPGEKIQFNNTDGVTLVWIDDNSVSQINGSLKATGRIILINPHGFVFGKNAKVDVKGLIASVANISEEHFLNNETGKYDFNIASNDPNAAIINHGHISTIAEQGFIVMVAPNVINADNGIITANSGLVSLGIGDRWKLDLSSNVLIQFGIDKASAATLYQIVHTGKIIARAGRVHFAGQGRADGVKSLINYSGIFEMQALGPTG
jgi:filamentous hemagglutinin family protein